MVNPNRRSIAPVRKLLAGVVGAIAAFIAVFGLGMGSWAVVVLGVALLALAIGLAMVNVTRRGARAWVAGTAHVRACSEPPAGVAYGRAELSLVVAAPGLPAAAVTVRDPRVPVAKWPDPGATLPVLVAVDDMRRVRIQWDDVMTHAEAAVDEDGEYPDTTTSSYDATFDAEAYLADTDVHPWVTQRDRQRWAASPEQEAAGAAGGIAVRDDTPGGTAGPIVLEGTLVEPDAPPLQRRRPSPRPRRDDTSPPPPATDPSTGDSPSDPSRESSSGGSDSGDAAPDGSAADGSVAASSVSDGSVSDGSASDRSVAGDATDTAASAPAADPEVDLPLDDPAPAAAGESGARAEGAAAQAEGTTGSGADEAAGSGETTAAAPAGTRSGGTPPISRSPISEIDEPRPPVTGGVNGTNLSDPASRRPAPEQGRGTPHRPPVVPAPRSEPDATPTRPAGVPAPRPEPGTTPGPGHGPQSDTPASERPPSDTRPSDTPTSDTSTSDTPPSDAPTSQAASSGAIPAPATSRDDTSTGAVAPDAVTPDAVERPGAVAANLTAENPLREDETGGRAEPEDGGSATATPSPAGPAAASPDSADAPAGKGSTAAKAAGLGLVAAGLAAAGLAAVGKRTEKSNRADADDTTDTTDTADRGDDAPATDSNARTGTTAPTGTAQTVDRSGSAADPTSPAATGYADSGADGDSVGALDELITAYPSARPGPAGAIHGIGMTVLVTDLDRSRRFYRDLLGFHEIDSGRGNAVLASGDTRLVLRVVTEVSAVRARPVHLNLEVGDVNAMHAELAGQGARFVHGPRVVARGEKLELWAASLADPDGHSVDISQWRAVVD